VLPHMRQERLHRLRAGSTCSVCSHHPLPACRSSLHATELGPRLLLLAAVGVARQLQGLPARQEVLHCKGPSLSSQSAMVHCTNALHGRVGGSESNLWAPARPSLLEAQGLGQGGDQTPPP
jgi:hypothetical protein